MLHLLFDESRDFLAEVFTHRGAMSRVVLTSHGREILGPQVEVWQTRGVPVRKEVPTTDGHAFYLERVQPRTERFSEALAMWVFDRAYLMVEMEEAHATYWPRLLSLPITPSERVAFVLMLRSTDKSDLGMWDLALEEAHREAVQDPAKAAGPLLRARKKPSMFATKT